MPHLGTWVAGPKTALAWMLASALAFCSCATYESDLARGHHAFEENEHERALAIFRGLEPDVGRLSTGDRAHYAYLRGMTDYRVGYKAEARHWLALASAIEQQAPGSLPPEWSQRMAESLKELNEEVYTAGIGSLMNGSSPSVEGKAAGEGEATPTSGAPGEKRDGATKTDEP